MEQSERAASRVTYSFGPFLLDPAEHRLARDGRDLRLPPKVFETLILLVERHGLLVTKDELMKALWPDTFVEEVTLARNISLLRKALDDLPGQDQSQYIDTVSKRGYRFIAKVREIHAQAPSSGEPSSAGSEISAPAGAKAWWGLSRVWFAVLVFVMALIAIATFREFDSGRRPSVGIHSLAVLPLENLSADPEQEYFADGMTDELITDLAQIHSLRVISRTSVMQFKHTKKPLREIAVALNVDAIVEGSVSRLGNNVHITAQLLDARQDRHLWAASYERQMEDISGLQRQVAKAIADQVKANLTPEEDARLTKREPRNAEAYDALLRGRFLTSIRNRDPDRLRKAIAYFQQAVAIDPGNAEAWAELGDGYASLGGDYEAEDPSVMRPKARVAIAKALELDPGLADGYIASAWLKMYDWDAVGAERDFQRAIELNPNNSNAHRRYSFYLRTQNRFNEALEETNRAIDLAPLDIMPQIHLAVIYENAGMADKAIEQANRVLELDPNLTSAYRRLGEAYALKHQWAQAIAAFEHVKQSDRVCYLGSVAMVWAASGNTHKAEAAMAELRKYSEHNYVSPFRFAGYEAKFGDQHEALQWLKKAYQQHDPGMIEIEIDYGFVNLRSDARFQELKRRVGFKQ